MLLATKVSRAGCVSNTVRKEVHAVAVGSRDFESSCVAKSAARSSPPKHAFLIWLPQQLSLAKYPRLTGLSVRWPASRARESCYAVTVGRFKGLRRRP